jgi:hypothetical protein
MGSRYTLKGPGYTCARTWSSWDMRAEALGAGKDGVGPPTYSEVKWSILLTTAAWLHNRALILSLVLIWGKDGKHIRKFYMVHIVAFSYVLFLIPQKWPPGCLVLQEELAWSWGGTDPTRDLTRIHSLNYPRDKPVTSAQMGLQGPRGYRVWCFLVLFLDYWADCAGSIGGYQGHLCSRGPGRKMRLENFQANCPRSGAESFTVV